MRTKARKLIWSAPLVAVLAVAGALVMFVALAPNAVQAHGLPGAPMNLMGEAAGTRAIDLDWNPPTSGGSPTGYRVDRSVDGNTWTTLEADTGSVETAYQDTKVKHGEVWYYRVFAINSAGTGPVSTDILVQADVAKEPGSVRVLRATVVDQNKIELTWQPPASDGGTDITHYEIRIGDNDETTGDTGTGDNYPLVPPVRATAALDGGEPVDGIFVTDDTTTSYTHDKLRAGTRYVYQVYAVNLVGLSLNPGDSEGATTRALVKPGAPSGLTAVQTNVGSVLLYWYAPTNIGGGKNISYRVQASVDATENEPDNSFTEYANATNGASVTPGATVSADFDYTVNNADRVKFRVYTLSDPDPAITTDTVLVSERHSGEVTVTIRAEAARALLIPDAPDFDEGDSNDNIPSDAIRDGFGSVDLDWDAPDIDPKDEAGADDPPSIGGYRIDVSDDGISWKQLVRNTRRTDTEYHYNDPDRMERHYRIFAWHGQYLGPAQAAVVASVFNTGDQGVPGYVTGLTATPNGPTQIDLSWTKPTNEGNAPITQYIIRGVLEVNDGFVAFPDDAAEAEDNAALLYATSKTTSYPHEELSAGQTWKYQVVAVNDNGETGDANVKMEGERTRALVRQATTPKESTPRAPEGLTAEDAKDSNLEGAESRGVLLLWNAPVAPAGATIDKYVVERKVGMTGDWTRLENQSTNTWTDYTDTDEPDSGELRGYRVAAVSNNGVMGDWSNTAYYPHMLTMHNTPPMMVGMIDPVTVTAGEMSGAMDVSAYFSDADTDDTLTYTAMSDMTSYATADIPAGSSMLTITGVAAGMATVTVTATDAAGDYARQTIMVTVEAADVTLGVPGGVMTSDATTNPGTLLVKVDWTPGDNAVGHLVMLFTDDWQGAPMVEGMPTGNSHTFTVDAGSYIAVVVAYDADGDIQLAISGVTSVGGS